MAADYPINADNERDAWFRAADNFYQFAILRGASGIEAPEWNDSIRDLLFKMAQSSAAILG